MVVFHKCLLRANAHLPSIVYDGSCCDRQRHPHRGSQAGQDVDASRVDNRWPDAPSLRRDNCSRRDDADQSDSAPRRACHVAILPDLVVGTGRLCRLTIVMFMPIGRTMRQIFGVTNLLESIGGGAGDVSMFIGRTVDFTGRMTTPTIMRVLIHPTMQLINRMTSTRTATTMTVIATSTVDFTGRMTTPTVMSVLIHPTMQLTHRMTSTRTPPTMTMVTGSAR